MEAAKIQSALPYRDTKAQGAADFYFAINATFRFIIEKFGIDSWKQYLETMGRSYFEPVNRGWKSGGLEAVAAYWKEFFAAEPNVVVDICRDENEVVLNVVSCPALNHLRAHGRTPVKQYCQHCYYLGQARAQEADMEMRLTGGNGVCQHRYIAKTRGLAPQSMDAIKKVTP